MSWLQIELLVVVVLIVTLFVVRFLADRCDSSRGGRGGW